MDKVVFVHFESLDHTQVELLHRYIRRFLRTRFVPIPIVEMSEMYTTISRELPRLIVIIHTYQHNIWVAALNSQIAANQELHPLIWMVSPEELNRSVHQRKIDYVPRPLPFQPNPTGEFPQRYLRLSPDEVQEDIYDRRTTPISSTES